MLQRVKVGIVCMFMSKLKELWLGGTSFRHQLINRDDTN
jgi:hypothetical protein